MDASGILMYPNSRAAWMFDSIERPKMAMRRPYLMAASQIWRIREMFEENVAMMMRDGAERKMSSIDWMTDFSEGV